MDDLPVVTNGIEDYTHRLDITHQLIAVFTSHHIPAIGYVNEGKLYHNRQLDSMEVQLLELWLTNGLELGNHTYSHLNYHEVPFGVFTENILQGELIIKPLAAKYDSKVRYFRHPYLRSGKRHSQSDSLQHFLNSHQYTEAPVTLDNDDYLFAAAFAKAYQKKDSALMHTIGESYLQHMEAKLIYYEKQSVALFERSISQILLIHASLLNANYANELILMYQRHGYLFTSQTEVLTDPVYRETITKFGDWGISWIDRWALSRGKRGDFFKDDPETPAYIRKLAQ